MKERIWIQARLFAEYLFTFIVISLENKKAVSEEWIIQETMSPYHLDQRLKSQKSVGQK